MNETITVLQEQVWPVWIICILAGYLPGSVSFARLMYTWVTKSGNYEPFSETVPHTGEVFESDLISATWVTKKLGKKYGCLTSVADMIKVGLPTLAIKLIFTIHPYFLITAIFGILGHNYPLWYRFKGGRGESPMLAVLAVINWFGILVANGTAMFLGMLAGSVLVIRWGGYVIMIFWYWYWFRDFRYVLFMIFANLLFWSSMWKDLVKFVKLKRKYGNIYSEEDISQFIEMGRTMGKFADKYGLYHVIKRKISFIRKKS